MGGVESSSVRKILCSRCEKQPRCRMELDTENAVNGKFKNFHEGQALNLSQFGIYKEDIQRQRLHVTSNFVNLLSPSTEFTNITLHVDSDMFSRAHWIDSISMHQQFRACDDLVPTMSWTPVQPRRWRYSKAIFRGFGSVGFEPEGFSHQICGVIGKTDQESFQGFHAQGGSCTRFLMK